MITPVNQRIIIKEDMKVNNSPLKLEIAFLNQLLLPDQKNSYYKLLIWLIGDEYVSNFDYQLFFKVHGNQILVPIENLKSNFQPNHQQYLIAKIPSKNFDLDFDEFTYTFVHDQLFKGQGHIFLNLKLNFSTLVDNELLFYAHQQSWNLIIRHLKFAIPEFYFNQHYLKIFTMIIETLDFSYLINLDPIRLMAELVKNQTWLEPIQILGLNLTFLAEPAPEYDFDPKFEIEQAKNTFNLNLKNFLTLNSQQQVVEGGLEQGMYFNPFMVNFQKLELKMKIFHHEQTFEMAIQLPKLNFETNFKGDWIAV